jgi:hypothetical protein
VETEHWRKKVFALVGLKHITLNVISVLPCKRMEMLDVMVKWYSRKAPFGMWD